MSDPLDLLIEQEIAKLRVLESEVSARKQRIQTLRAMKQNSDLDAVLAEKINAAAKPEQQQLPAEISLTAGAGRSKHGAVKRALLSMLNKNTGTHLKTLLDGMAKLGRPMDNKRMRAEMWAHKQDGLVSSDEPGWFKLTDKGEAFLEAQKGETAGATAVSGATSSADDLL